MYTYLKLIFENCDDSNMPLITHSDAAIIFDLKQNLEYIFNVPASELSLLFLDFTLDDNDLLWKIFSKRRETETPSTWDLMAIHKGFLVCKIKFVEGVESDSCQFDPNLFRNPRCYMNNNNCRTFTNISSSSRRLASAAGCSSMNLSSNSTLSLYRNPSCRKLGSADQSISATSQHAVLIESDGPMDIKSILQYLATRLKESLEGQSLNFSMSAPVVPVQNSVTLVCENSNTSDWIMRVSRLICPPYKCTKFIKPRA